MEAVELMLVVILMLVGAIFGTLLGLMYKFDKLQKAVNELERLEK